MCCGDHHILEGGSEPCSNHGCAHPCDCHPMERRSAFQFAMGREVAPRGLLHLAMLSILKDKAMHGGNIHQSLKEKFGIDPAKPIVYIMLRRMEGAGLVISQWDTTNSGPARRVYQITQEGLDYLKESTERLKNAARIIRMLVGEEL